MSIVTRVTAKSYFETGDKPTQAQFGDFIDSAMFQEDFSTFGKAFVSASTTAAALNLLGFSSIGTVGNNILSATTTASAQTQLGGGTVGRNIFETTTTASATNLLQNATTSVRGISYLSSPVIISYNSIDPDNDIDFSAGIMTFSNGQAVATALTKRLDATWAAGTNQGGLFSGSKANSTWYHCFSIYNSSTSTYDAGFDTDATGANAPSGYTQREWRGAILTDGSGNIIKFLCNDFGGGLLEFIWDAPRNDVTLSSLSTSATLRTLSTPLGIKTIAITNISWTGDNNATGVRYGLITSPDQTDNVPSATLFNITSYFGSQEDPSAITRFETRTNTSSQIRDRFDTTGGTMVTDGYKISTIGWRYKA